MTTTKTSLPEALRRIRKARGLSQEAFSGVSSRTYLSSLERGLKSPTLNKLEDLCEVLAVHPLTLLALIYCENINDVDDLLMLVKKESASIFDNQRGS
ncbi:helix-turn-helix domain-containing protein [Marinobacter segnicrescens]|uniref:helix-turn-helix domain-containing protein n=1 Tax=Pseudomonadales TaxID=72274 RepID=UPI003A94FF0C